MPCRGDCDQPVEPLPDLPGRAILYAMLTPSTQTVSTESRSGQYILHLNEIKNDDHSYLVFNKKKIAYVAKISIGRESDNTVVVDDQLASRHHCVIQKIKDDFFVKDEDSTNGTFVNGSRIPPDKWVKLNPGDKITVGGSVIEIS